MDRQFSVTLDDIVYRIEMHGNTVLVNGRPFVIGFEGGFVTVDGTRYEVNLSGETVQVNGIAHAVAFEGLGALETRPGQVSRAGEAPRGLDEIAEGAGLIKAIMPGKVIRVAVAEGDEVQEGDVTIILEAMKMENELRTDRAGVVKQVAVSPGDDVELGQLLVVIE